MNTTDRGNTPSSAAPADRPAALPRRIARVDAHVLRWPVQEPVRTSFGTMLDRPAVLVRVEDEDGAFGWGEAWCNFPACGAEHRARLVETLLAPLLVGADLDHPARAFELLTRRTAVLVLQTGEPGPVAQAIAGVDTALHDLAARRAGLPLWRWLGGDSDRVAAYASGINPDRPGRAVEALQAQGHTRFKLKVGFGAARDRANVAELRAAAGPQAALMVDANQAWDLPEAVSMAEALGGAGLAWLEEPLRADRPAEEWRQLAAASPVPLAAGENCIGEAAYEALIASRAVAVVQPDLAKWGGLSGLRPLVARIHAAGLRWCPHYLGAGVGLLASAHLLAALGRPDGLLEVDSNENPLRSLLAPPLQALAGGELALGDAPGLGVEPDLAACRALCVSRAGV
ncbi:mandelate racemase/muconate lactonizing enzyme family protein [Piscinibacter sakaiensis]|uniref:Putative mandelate racemase/muconate lactonizing enzyme n=1 Tax=Piscinibacter sakaiensis TaxID=1547922 RepID=A0A0K8P482_PISS1|nr:mandelate racemase/muconate lactonizing enzyme family protein [Piscinibacter sakaiensis]GAP37452.1 putative mandelate racemase/muconate lactonizing enzyme [Piscinibacter sakaiensis]